MAMRSSAWRITARYYRPALLMTSRLTARANYRRPSVASSDLTCWLTAAWVTPSSVAACERFSFRAAASKALSAFNGGRRRVIGMALYFLETILRRAVDKQEPASGRALENLGSPQETMLCDDVQLRTMP